MNKIGKIHHLYDPQSHFVTASTQPQLKLRVTKSEQVLVGCAV